MSFVLKKINGNLARLMIVLFFCVIYFTLIVHGIDKQDSFVELFNKVISLISSLAAFVAAYTAYVGVHTWRKQLVAANKYPSLLACRKMSVRLKNETLRMLDRVYAYGYQENLINDYRRDGTSYLMFDRYFKDMDELFVELESNFGHSFTDDSQTSLTPLLHKLRLHVAVHLRLIEMREPNMVSCDELEFVLFQKHEKKLLNRKRKIQELFTQIVLELDLLESQI